MEEGRRIHRFTRCIICSNYSFQEECYNIFDTTLEKGKVLLSDFVKNVLNCSVLIVVSPDFFLCKRCYTLCSDLDCTLAKCEELQSTIQGLFKKAKENDQIKSCLKRPDEIKTEKLDEEEFVFEEPEEYYRKGPRSINGDTIEDIQSFLETEFVVDETVVVETSPPVPEERSANKTAAVSENEVTEAEDNDEESNTPRKWTCKGCKLNFDSKEELKTHRIISQCKVEESRSRKIKSMFEFNNFSVKLRKKKKVFFCNRCTYETTVPASMEKHLLTHKSDPLYMCDVCGRRFKYMKTFTKHQQVHDDSRPFACKLCPYRAVNEFILKNHEKQHNDQIKYTCSKCGYKTLKKMAFLIHSRTHTGERPYSCPSCPYKAKDPSTLIRHRRTHGGLKRYTCTLCDYKGLQKAALKMHMMTHTGEKPHACSKCDYKSSAKHNLAAHFVAKHCDEKPFACTLCNYRTKVKRLLTYHMRGHSDEKPFACMICDYRVRHKAALRYHMSKKHPINAQTGVRQHYTHSKDVNRFEGENVEFSDDMGTDSEDEGALTVQTIPEDADVIILQTSADGGEILALQTVHEGEEVITLQTIPEGEEIVALHTGPEDGVITVQATVQN